MDCQEKKQIIIDFLKKCNTYGDKEIVRYQAQLEGNETDAQLIRKKIENWQIYQQFNEHAMGELQGSELDNWFDDA